jgi:hypothetical protein
MLFSKKEIIEDKIIRILLTKNQTVKSIRRELETEGVSVTIQGIYKALRVLISEEIALKRLMSYSINEEWRRKITEHFATKKEPLLLSESETLKFDLNSLIHLDQQWKNVIFPLQDQYSNYPVFSYNPHEIWIHLSENRKKSEIEYHNLFERKKIPFYVVIGGETNQDKETSKQLEGNYVRFSIGDKAFSETDYPTIINDYIITTRISSKLAQKIESCYQNSNSISELEQKLALVGIEKARIKLIIERNKEKAKKLRKRLSKDFYIPKELREQFDLF